jgi:hypothetical protein
MGADGVLLLRILPSACGVHLQAEAWGWARCVCTGIPIWQGVGLLYVCWYHVATIEIACLLHGSAWNWQQSYMRDFCPGLSRVVCDARGHLPLSQMQ